jgi:hypothetical protein
MGIQNDKPGSERVCRDAEPVAHKSDEATAGETCHFLACCSLDWALVLHSVSCLRAAPPPLGGPSTISRDSGADGGSVRIAPSSSVIAAH